MAEQPPLMPIRRPRGPSPRAGSPPPHRGRWRAIVLAVGAGVAAVIVALPHVHTTKAVAPPPPPPPKPFRVIFPEGFTRAQMIERVGAVAKIAARKKRRAGRAQRPDVRARDAPREDPVLLRRRSARTSRDSSSRRPTTSWRRRRPAQLAADQLETFCKNWNQVNLAYAKSKNLTPYDVLIIASMVEKETLAPDERPKVAAVIYNRLHARMPLGIDATLRYGLHIPPTQSILQSQLDSDNPYNSRKRTGLPPTPIANPGLASIQAAAHPAKVDYLYFVRKPDKVHHFFTASDTAFAQYECAHGYGC